jgi:glutathione S-transferase
MELIGMLDSPYVRRVAITLKHLNVPFEHRGVSVFRHFDEFASINPVVKAPTLICDNGTLLVDSTLILQYLDDLTDAARDLSPTDFAERVDALHIIGLALTACEKTVQIVYERELRPIEKQHAPWIERVKGQLDAAYRLLEARAAQSKPDAWLFGDRLLQADITTCVAFRFTQHMIPDVFDGSAYPVLARLSARAEALPEFVATPL